MADIDLYQDDGSDNSDDGYGLDDGLDCDEPFGTDDNLSALQKLEKYMESDNVYTRQMVAKGLLDTLRAVGDSEEQTTAVLNAMVKLSEDVDALVRSELMEQIAHIAVYCQENADIFHNAVPVYILPMVVRYLDDDNSQVRKNSHAALLVLLEQELITREHIDEQVVSVILELASADSLDEYRTEAVALMSKMAPMLGKEMTERVFLDKFCEMCSDPLFHVRKVCAANFGDFCSVVSQQSTETKLLPKFYYLCEDGVWGVRKECAECFMTVSCTCSCDVRKTELAALFVSLLCDQSRWVRGAAFRQLGPFISTFADSDSTGMYVEEDGRLVFKPSEEMKRRQKEKEEAETVVSELVDCDTKSLPDVIPANVLDGSNGASTNCDITANLLSLDTDTSADKLNNENDSEGTDVDQIAQLPETSAAMEISEDSEVQTVSGLVQTDDNVSVEERRAEHYQSTDSTSTCDGNTELGPDTNTNNGNTDVNIRVLTLDDISIENKDNSIIGSNLENDLNLAEQGNLDSNNTDNEHVQIELDNPSNFDSFHFWRTPLPQVELDLDILQADSESTSPQATEHSSGLYTDGRDLSLGLSSSLQDLTVCDNQPTSVILDDQEPTVRGLGQLAFTSGDSSETTMTVIDGVVQDLSSASNLAYIDSDFTSLREASPISGFMLHDDATLAQQQGIVPQSLLENYLGMIDPSKAQTVDTEITKNCAYSLPAVAYTLGRDNWHCIKNLYETLAADMQWKVRRTLAFSIHELAVILGEEITHRDLVPVFDGFLKDLDEVRVGILRHLADFLRLLHPDVRRHYLIKVQDFMNVDNSRNWRFRLELCEQLILISELFSACEISDHLLPMAMALAEDRVAQVRGTAYKLVGVMLRRMVESGDEKIGQYLVNKLIARFAHNPKWTCRQIFTQLCQAVVIEESVSPAQFARDLLPSLLEMVTDPVPNVRITLSKAMFFYMANERYSHYDGHPCPGELEEAVQKLHRDSDRDVRYYCTAEAHQEITVCLDDSETYA